MDVAADGFRGYININIINRFFQLFGSLYKYIEQFSNFINICNYFFKCKKMVSVHGFL